MSQPSNPFPGLDPFFQESWNDVLVRLFVGITDVLGEALPEGFVARIDHFREGEDVELEESPAFPVVKSAPWPDDFPPVAGTGEVLVSTPIVLITELEKDRWLEIRNFDDRVITVIKALSLANKTEQGARDYRQRQRDWLRAGINLVEMDFVRGGEHVVAVPMERLAHIPDTSQLICVARSPESYIQRREIYPCPLRQALPTIRIPLRAGDPDQPLALQPLFDRIYQTGRYWMTDGRREIAPPLPPDDATWVEERLKAAGLK